MDAKDYRSKLRNELIAWKAKIYDITGRVENLDGGAKQRVLYNLQDFTMFITDMGDRIHKLETERPTEWRPIKEKIDEAHVDVRGKYKETMDAIGKAAPVSTPG